MKLDPLLYQAVADAAARMRVAHERDREVAAMRDVEGPDADRSPLARLAHLLNGITNDAEDQLVEAMLVAGLAPDANHYTNARRRAHEPIGVVVGDTLWLALDQERWPSGVTESKPDGEHHMMSLHAIPIDRLVGLVLDPAADAEGGA